MMRYTFLISFVAFSSYTAGDVGDEGFVRADAFDVERIATAETATDAVLLLNRQLTSLIFIEIKCAVETC